jgi:hypothetical protein
LVGWLLAFYLIPVVGLRTVDKATVDGLVWLGGLAGVLMAVPTCRT